MIGVVWFLLHVALAVCCFICLRQWNRVRHEGYALSRWVEPLLYIAMIGNLVMAVVNGILPPFRGD